MGTLISYSYILSMLYTVLSIKDAFSKKITFELLIFKLEKMTKIFVKSRIICNVSLNFYSGVL